MSRLCAVTTCKQVSNVLCHCCNRDFCWDHLSGHHSFINDQSNSLTNQINILNERLQRLDVDALIERNRQKLDQWRDHSSKTVSRFYDRKCEELEQYYDQLVNEQREEIDQLYKKSNVVDQKQDDIRKNLQLTILNIKKQLDKIEQNIVPINTRSLSINNNLITIGKMTLEEFNIAKLSNPYQILTFSENLSFGMAANDEVLLIDQNSDISLFDKDLTLIGQSVWKYGTIRDICWSSELSSFIAITDQSKAFLVHPKNLTINHIEEMNNHLWLLCTCSKSLLYLASLGNGIVEFSLLPSIYCTRRWDPPITCQKNELIKDIACHENKITLLIANIPNKTTHLVLRSLTTFDQLHSIRLDIKNLSNQLPMHCCPFKDNEWLVAEANSSQLFHITKDGKAKGILLYDQPLYNIVLFGSNILVIRTDNTVNFHEV